MRLPLALLAASSLVAFTAILGCSGSPETGCGPSNPSCASSDAAPSFDGGIGATDGEVPSDAASMDANDSGYCRYIDDAGVTHGCGAGSMGPGDRDDGGGADVGPPTASPDASDLAFGASCLDNAQCASSICFEYKAKGRFCTQPCMTDQDCPAENQLMTLGCNGMGLCRVSGN